VGREEAFYKACYDAVCQLDQDGFTALIDDDGRDALAQLTQAYDHITAPTLPPRLLRNPDLQLQDAAPGQKLVNSYSAYDTMVLPDDLLALLDAFTPDKTLDEVRAHLKTHADAELDDDFLIELYQYRLLIEPED